MLDQKINSAGLEVTIESKDVEKEVNATLLAHNEGTPEAASAGYSTTTYILMGLGGLVGAAVVIGALGTAIRERLVRRASQGMASRVPQLGMLEEANIPARKGRLEIEFKTDVITVDHCENKNAKNMLRLVEP